MVQETQTDGFSSAAGGSVELTLLSSLAGSDFPQALQKQAGLALRLLDLKDGLWGRRIEEIDEATAVRAAELCAQEGMSVDCLSTSIGRVSLEETTHEDAFRAAGQPRLENALQVAHHLRPRAVRLLMPMLEEGGGGESAYAKVRATYPWLVFVYQDWVDQIEGAGCQPVLENEAFGCLFATPDDIERFFEDLDRPAARFLWDAQNLWQMGVAPSLAVYRQLRRFMGGLHLKGGRAGESGKLETASALEDASWPVLEIVKAVVADGTAPVICLNPSHGRKPPGWDAWEVACRDVEFLRKNVPQIR